ncbi:MAG: tandem-95 repeat protein, partial [Proteobacteria bacterium]|nr:tandem-95 repeat protein [Pseudomonadota bacterium]
AEGGTLTVSATLTDLAGNTSPAGSDSAVLDTTATIDIHTIASESQSPIGTDANSYATINAPEKAAGFTVSGVASGVEAGQTVTVDVLNSANVVVGTVTGTVNAAGNWTASVPAGASWITDGASYNFRATVNDLAGNAATDSDSTNAAPVVAGSTLAGSEDTPLTLNWASFGISDVDSPSLTSATISALPTAGRLQVLQGATWVDVQVGDVVSKSAVDAGELRFVPGSNEAGGSMYPAPGLGDQHADYASFEVSVSDGSGGTASGTVVIDITPLADAPSLLVDASTTGSVAGGNTITVPAASGLTLSFYDNIATLVSGAQSSSPDLIETGIESATPTTTTTIYNVGPDAGAVVAGNAGTAIGIDDAYRVSGLVYMEAGKNYVFSGYVDDSFRLEIGGVTVVSGQWGGAGEGSAGSFTATTFTPTVSGYYTIDLFAYNTSGPGSYDLNLSVDGGAVENLSTANFALYTSIADVDAGQGQHSAFVANTTTAEGGYYPVSLNSGQEDTSIKLSALSAAFADTADNSESHLVTISGIPLGSVISDGTKSYTATATSLVIWNEDHPETVAGGSNWNLATLTITPPPNYNGSFSLTATATATEIATGDAASTSTAWTVTVDAVNDAPVVGSATASVSEEALAGGINETPSVAVSATAFGTVTVSDVDSSPTLSLLAPTATITSGGVALTWTGSGTSTLVGSVGGVEVIRATIDNDGNYSVTLAKGIDQPNTSTEDSSTITFGVQATDGSATTTGSLVVTVADDSPLAVTSTVQVGDVASATNLSIVLDLSGSMDNSAQLTGDTAMTRITATIAAIKEVIDGYDSLGEVMVNIVTFGNTANNGSWMTAANALLYLDTLSANLGGTNYDAALAAAIDSFAASGKLTGSNVQNVLYFLSDGQPNDGDGNANAFLNLSGGGDAGIQTTASGGTEETLWQNFLNTNAINAFAFGIGGGVTTTAMDPVAYNGITGTDRSSAVVSDLSTLNATLAATVTSSVSGTITSGTSSTGSFGGDGGYLASITYGSNVFTFDGSTLSRSGAGTTAYSFDSATHVLTLTTVGGSFVIDMDTGGYTFSTTAASSVAQENFSYLLTDFDGDTSSGALTINLNGYNAAPLARDESIIVASGSVDTSTTPYAVTIKDSWLLWNDSDPENDPLSIFSASNATSHNSSQVVDVVSSSNSGTATAAGSFSYETSDGNQQTSATATIYTRNSATLTGSGLDNILVGDSSAETIRGNEGNDVLVGNAGNDTLNGGIGNDLLIGGTGNDGLTGGSGADVFRWELADKGTAGSAGTTASDTVADFSTATAGEYLDLRDLLLGHGSSLTDYIDIVTSGSNTVIRVSSGGGFAGGTYAAATEDERITLTGVDLYNTYGVTAGDDATLIQTMINNGKLKVD